MALIPQVKHDLRNLKTNKRPSTIIRALTIAKELQIVATLSLVKAAAFPYCFKLTSTFISTLQHHLKNATSN
ncbi:unnamed protein product, partial [Ceratitis capitata]